MTNNKSSELTKNTILFALSNFGTKLISFFLVPLYTYALTTEEYGIVDIISTTVILIVPMLSLNIQDAVLRFSFDKNYKSENVISIALKIITFSSVLLGFVLIIFRITNLFKIEGKFLLYLWLNYVLTSLSNSVQMYLKTKDKVKVIVAAALTSTIVTCLSNVILLLILKIGINGYLISSVLGSLISVIICISFGSIISDYTFKIDKQLFISMIKYSSPLIINSIAWWINSGSDKYILTFFEGTASEGVYAIASKIPNILSIFQTVFYNAWAISAIRDFDKNDTDGFIGNTYTLYSFVSIVGCSLLIAINPFLSLFLYRNDFFEANNYVPALLIATMFNGMALLEGCLYAAVKKTSIITYSTVVGAVINTVLNFVFIPKSGAYGASIATMIGYIIVWAIRSILLHRIINIKCKWTVQIISILLIWCQLFTFSLNFHLAIQVVIFTALFTIQFMTSRIIIKNYVRSLIGKRKLN